MFHVEIRAGMQVVRKFNLTDRRLWLEFLAPLMADKEFSVEGHEFVPRQSRLTIYEGPELRPDQLGMGRGWQNAERSASDVTERVLARTREHVAANAQTAAADATPPPTTAASVDLLRERLIGRLSAGPITGQELCSIAAELMPDSGENERLESARQAVWALLERDAAQLAPSAR
jgi:hypothetical protein